MSRPFSYHDENFTVIGNVLFCHIKIKKKILHNKPIVEIPPAIFARMLFYTQHFFQVFPDINSVQCYDLEIGVGTEDNKKYFLNYPEDITEIGSYVIGYYILKDI